MSLIGTLATRVDVLFLRSLSVRSGHAWSCGRTMPVADEP